MVRYNLAYAHALNREYEQAGAVLNTDFARTTEQVPEAYILAARMKHFLADIKTAVGLVEKFLLQYPDHPFRSEARSVLALLMLDDDNVPKAKKNAELALAENPNNIESLQTRGNLCLNDLRSHGGTILFRESTGQTT